MVALLIGLHVVLGSMAALGMIIAWMTTKGSLWHRGGGKAYVLGMAGAIAVSFVVSVVKQNVFLFFVGLFSAYLVYTGYRLAVAKDSTRNAVDMAIAWFILFTALLMFLFAINIFNSDKSMAIILVVFGAIGGSLAYSDFRRGSYWPKGKERIVMHVERMGGANIATITAVFVVNVQTNPAFIAWLLPSVIGSFLISHQMKKLRTPAPKPSS